MNQGFSEVVFEIFTEIFKNLHLVNKFCFNFYKENKEYICKKFLEKHQIKYSDPNIFIHVYKNSAVFIEILLKTSPEILKKLFLVNKFCYNFYKENKEYICKKFLEKYSVDYSDPTNFIYIYNKVNISDYKLEGTFNYLKILKLYMKNFYCKKIICNSMGISSFPIYPKMVHFDGSNNSLTSFPVQPKMKFFKGENNKLRSFPVQPKMKFFEGNSNQLTTFPVQPNMTHFYGNYNESTSFQVQPNMTHFYGSHNSLTFFPVQPHMEYFKGNYNQLTSFPIQPKMKHFSGDEYILTN